MTKDVRKDRSPREHARSWVDRHPFARNAVRLARSLLHLLFRPRKAWKTVTYRLRLGHCGRNVDFEVGMIIRNPGIVSIGKNCSFSSFVVLDAHGPITIGDDCLFALRVTVSTATHDYGRSPMRSATLTKPVVIGSDVWFGVGATVLPGVTIGDGAVIGAHALVTRDVPPYAIIVGIPGRIIKYRSGKEPGKEGGSHS